MDTEPETFEATLARLEECVEALEQGGLTLEAALARFEEGMRLAARCEAILAQAELRVTQLLAETDADSTEASEPAF
jgi:exodeoxyribonuclease VII small subunit